MARPYPGHGIGNPETSASLGLTPWLQGPLHGTNRNSYSDFIRRVNEVMGPPDNGAWESYIKPEHVTQFGVMSPNNIKELQSPQVITTHIFKQFDNIAKELLEVYNFRPIDFNDKTVIARNVEFGNLPWARVSPFVVGPSGSVRAYEQKVNTTRVSATQSIEFTTLMSETGRVLFDGYMKQAAYGLTLTFVYEILAAIRTHVAREIAAKNTAFVAAMAGVRAHNFIDAVRQRCNEFGLLCKSKHGVSQLLQLLEVDAAMIKRKWTAMLCDRGTLPRLAGWLNTKVNTSFRDDAASKDVLPYFTRLDSSPGGLRKIIEADAIPIHEGRPPIFPFRNSCPVTVGFVLPCPFRNYGGAQIPAAADAATVYTVDRRGSGSELKLDFTYADAYDFRTADGKTGEMMVFCTYNVSTGDVVFTEEKTPGTVTLCASKVVDGMSINLSTLQLTWAGVTTTAVHIPDKASLHNFSDVLVHGINAGGGTRVRTAERDVHGMNGFNLIPSAEDTTWIVMLVDKVNGIDGDKDYLSLFSTIPASMAGSPKVVWEGKQQNPPGAVRGGNRRFANTWDMAIQSFVKRDLRTAPGNTIFPDDNNYDILSTVVFPEIGSRAALVRNDRCKKTLFGSAFYNGCMDDLTNAAGSRGVLHPLDP